MSNPAPRRSKFNPSYSEGNIDYDMTSPLDQVERKYPCIGYPPGPPTGTYKAGGTIPAKIVGDAPHNGGHCQFSLSYDGNNFVALDTILGDCPNGRDYSVKLPPNAPKGNAVFAWTWINRSGNREFYMNCADIKIDGPSTGAVTGHEMLVGNLKDFDNSYGKSYFSSTPRHTSLLPSSAPNADGSSTPATYISPSSAPNADGSSTSATYFYPSSAPNADGASTPVISVSPSGAPNAEGAQDEEGSDESSDDDKEGTDGSSNNGESADESSDEEPGLESGQGAKHCPPYTAKHANCPSVPKRKPY
ncbi:hypothetical protein L0F63_002890 [Massospora cicadina]|nr:hypothetical protein L0F63_002890 [Massospora cicadina]